MRKYKVISINLQQTIIVVDDPIKCAVRGVYDKHKDILILNPDPLENDEDDIWTLCEEIGIKTKHVMYGDGFGIDTWDKKIYNFVPTEIELEENDITHMN
jgi:hypothetical protein